MCGVSLQAACLCRVKARHSWKTGGSEHGGRWMQQQAPLTGAGLSEVIALDALCVGRWTTDELQRGYSSRGAVGQRFRGR
jgi:hypothetical protein